MDQKTKIAIPTLGILAFLVVGVIVFNSQKNTSKITNYPNQSQSFVNETQLTTTSTIVGDKAIDDPINSILNDVLSDDELDAELADIDLVLSDQNDIDQINNLFNDNEL